MVVPHEYEAEALFRPAEAIVNKKLTIAGELKRSPAR
jgi:hypothetical protein